MDTSNLAKWVDELQAQIDDLKISQNGDGPAIVDLKTRVSRLEDTLIYSGEITHTVTATEALTPFVFQTEEIPLSIDTYNYDYFVLCSYECLQYANPEDFPVITYQIPMNPVSSSGTSLTPVYKYDRDEDELTVHAAGITPHYNSLSTNPTIYFALGALSNQDEDIGIVEGNVLKFTYIIIANKKTVQTQKRTLKKVVSDTIKKVTKKGAKKK